MKKSNEIRMACFTSFQMLLFQKWFAPLAYITTLLFPLPLTWYIWWSEVDLHHLDDNDPCAGFMFGYKVPPWGVSCDAK